MADPSPLKRFYALFGLIAAAGIGFLLWQMNRSSTPSIPVPVTVQPSDTAGFRGYVLGDDSAKVEVIEYADYQCPACQQFATVEWPYVRDRLVRAGKVRWVFRDFPLSQHQWARLAAHAGACGQEQNKFWELQDEIFATQPEWQFSRDAGPTFRTAAQKVGMDVSAYDECMNSLKYAGRIQASANEGVRLGVGSTPTFVIGGRLYPGLIPYDRLRALVDSLSASP
ncbi:MAG TPA: thioredoxin domain-containing protein [Gemmatimonadales bacterium]